MAREVLTEKQEDIERARAMFERIQRASSGDFSQQRNDRLTLERLAATSFNEPALNAPTAADERDNQGPEKELSPGQVAISGNMIGIRLQEFDGELDNQPGNQKIILMAPDQARNLQQHITKLAHDVPGIDVGLVLRAAFEDSENIYHIVEQTEQELTNIDPDINIDAMPGLDDFMHTNIDSISLYSTPNTVSGVLRASGVDSGASLAPNIQRELQDTLNARKAQIEQQKEAQAKRDQEKQAADQKVIFATFGGSSR